MTVAYKKWYAQTQDIQDMNPVKARDLIVKCFFEAQKESFAEAGHALGQQPKDEDLQEMVVGSVRLAFRECNHDFDAPTVPALNQAVQVLARKAANWGTPLHIINHHKEQIGKILSALK